MRAGQVPPQGILCTVLHTISQHKEVAIKCFDLNAFPLQTWRETKADYEVYLLEA